MILFHIHDERRRPAASRPLGMEWTALAVPLDAANDVDSLTLEHGLFDVDITDPAKARRVRTLLGRMKRNGRRIFVCSPKDHHTVTQAHALGASDLVECPGNDTALLPVLDGIASRGGPPASAIIGAIALDLAFRSIIEAKPLPPGHMERVASSVTDDIRTIGIEAWLDSIRAHHTGTYQHCLIVTGLANAFAQSLKLPEPDIERLTVAALLHDIGKARVDPAILDKTGALTQSERAAIEMHPVWGERHLREHATVAEEIIDAVRHHHEMLDGSGYPDRLRGPQISEMTRLLTIADIFGALVESRAYKPSMPGEEAFGIIGRMSEEGKLEQALVQAFKPVAARLKDEPAVSPN